MKPASPGFTLLETLIASAIAGLILTAIIVGSSGLLSVSNAGRVYFDQASDQARVLDYVARDLRVAVSGSSSNNGSQLTLVLPAYTTGTDSYGSSDPNSGTAQTPTVTRDSTRQLTVSYSGTYTVIYQVSGGAIVRPQGNDPAAYLTDPSLSGGNSAWTMTFADSNDSSSPPAAFQIGTSGTTSTVRVQLAYMPIFRRDRSSQARSGTTVNSTIVLRN